MPNRKANLVETIHTCLTTPNNLRREWQLPDDVQQAAFSRNPRLLGYGVSI